jgi:proton translocating ATP synthase F1 alpha subunit
MSICLLDGYSPPISARSRKLVGIATGLRLVDVMFPIAQGQRELVIGDRQTGKTQVLVSSSFSQLFRNGQVGARKIIISYLSSLGQRTSSAVRSYTAIRYNNAAQFAVSLLASVTSTMSAQFIGPLSITALAELSRNIGNHAHVSYDDFSKHAIAYRQLCLYLRKPAGREAFPSDVFYLHARILERSCSLSHAYSLGTLLSLPVIETLSNDLSAYIATNVVSITDGQLYLDVTLFGIGNCPAISLDKSVSRVGAKSQDKLFRAVGFNIVKMVNDYKQESDSANKSEGFKLRAHRYSHLIAIFIQRTCTDRWSNLLYLFMLIAGLLDTIPSNMLHLTI